MQGTPRQCEFVKPNGVRCRANARTAAAQCWFHDPTLTRERHRARKRGGIARTSRRATLSADAPHRALGTVADVLGLLEATANEVRRGQLETRLANCVGYLCSVALNGLAQVPSRTSSVVQFLCVPPSESRSVRPVKRARIQMGATASLVPVPERWIYPKFRSQKRNYEWATHDDNRVPLLVRSRRFQGHIASAMDQSTMRRKSKQTLTRARH